LLKEVGQRGLLECARPAKPDFLSDPLREIETYRRILMPHHLTTATYYGAIVNPRTGHYWLFLENVPGLELYRVGIDAWQHVSRWLATMHAHFAGDIASLTPSQTAHLLRYTGDLYRLWMHRAQAIIHKRASVRDQDRRTIDWLAERYDRIVEHLLALPATVIHGECYASNVLVEERSDGLRVCPVDWEMAALGPGTLDLAALISGSWTDQERTALVMAYWSALEPHAGWSSSPKAFLAAVDASQVHLAVQWLGWSSEWSPPPAQAQNWLGVAADLAQKLGL
jgi:Ser/Thr protein kinase RdoA (MazF antagonist)